LAKSAKSFYSFLQKPATSVATGVAHKVQKVQFFVLCALFARFFCAKSTEHRKKLRRTFQCNTEKYQSAPICVALLSRVKFISRADWSLGAEHKSALFGGPRSCHF